MKTLDYVVLGCYFVALVVIGAYCALRVKKQEDFFMGGRGFGKLLQTFAAFGAGTGSSDPVNTGSRVFVSGMSGMWSVMYWLFVTPFYWIAAIWYRRMRHLTLGDWFVERYESKALGAGYAVFGILFQVVYGSMLFSAIGKMAAPLIGAGDVTIAGNTVGLEYVLVPVIGVVVLAYGIAGGLRAAYYTDLIQGLCIIVLSIILIPYGLQALVVAFPGNGESMLDGFAIMHRQIPPEHFAIIGTSSSEFPWYRILAVVLINLIGVVVQPHFIATGGGSAKTENNARVGLVLGNFLKRFCTIGWVLTALITLALFSGSAELVEDPDKVWGVASREILGPLNMGLVGLMVACLLAALMSSVDAYMVVGAGLVVRNVYAAYFNQTASEQEYVRVARWTSVFIVSGAVLVSLFIMDVFAQLELTWIVPVLFAAPFWIGMYWRRATTTAAWLTVIYCFVTFFLLPAVIPVVMPELRDRQSYAETNHLKRITTTRKAVPSDVAKRTTQIELWDKASVAVEEAYQRYLEVARDLKSSGAPAADPPNSPDADPLQLKGKNSEAIGALEQATAAYQTALAKLEAMGTRELPLEMGDDIDNVTTIGGKAIFWTKGVIPVDEQGRPRPDIKPAADTAQTLVEENVKTEILEYGDDVRLQGQGKFRLDLLLFHVFGMDLTRQTDAMLATLELPFKIVGPFVVMILLSLVTRKNSKQALDRYYSKMKTPVDPDPEKDQQNLAASMGRIEELEQRKLFPGSSFEFQKPRTSDVVGFVVSFAICFAVIAIAVWVAGIGRGG